MKKEITIEEIKNDFKLFLFYTWKHLLLPKPTPVQMEIADFIQNKSNRRIIVEAFRGVGKSWISATYVVWSLWNDVEEKVLVISATEKRAGDFTQFCQRLIKEMKFLTHLVGERENNRWSRLSFDVKPAKASQSPSVRAVGIKGQLSGSRASLIILDDVEIPNNSQTQDARENLINAIMETEAILIPKVGRTVFLGTPQTEESVYNKLTKKGFLTQLWPARVPEMSHLEHYVGTVSPSIVDLMEKGGQGQPTDPQRFTDIELRKRELSWGKSGFTLQFMLDTSLSDMDKYPLRLSDIPVLQSDITFDNQANIKVSWSSDVTLRLNTVPQIGFTGDHFIKARSVSEDVKEFNSTVMSVDPSGKGKDETAYAVVSELFSKLFLRDVGGFVGGYDDKALKGLVLVAKKNKCKKIVIEANFGQGMFSKLLTSKALEMNYHVNIEEIRSTKQKETRIIDVMEPLMNQHKLITSETVIKKDLGDLNQMNRSLFYQMTRICKVKDAIQHDDRLDATAMACQYMVEKLHLNEDLSIKEFRDDLLEQDLQFIIDNQINKGGQTPKVAAVVKNFSHGKNFNVLNRSGRRGR